MHYLTSRILDIIGFAFIIILILLSFLALVANAKPPSYSRNQPANPIFPGPEVVPAPPVVPQDPPIILQGDDVLTVIPVQDIKLLIAQLHTLSGIQLNTGNVIGTPIAKQVFGAKSEIYLDAAKRLQDLIDGKSGGPVPATQPLPIAP